MSLLVLQSLEHGRLCAKRWRPDGSKESYGNITWWRPIEGPHVTNIELLFKALVRLQARRDLCVVRGTLVDPTVKRMRRALRGDNAGLTDGDRSWVLCDFDELDTTTAQREQLVADPDVHTAALWAREHLPLWLRDVTLVARWSQSAGRDGYQKMKLHLWAWLDRAVCCGSLLEYVRNNTHLDPSVCHPIQAIYTADPIIEDGWTGGPTKRVALVPGARDAASPPASILDLATYRAKKDAEDAARRELARQWAAADRFRSPGSIRQRQAQRMERVVRAALDEMAMAPSGRRHGMLMRCAASIARTAAEIGFDPRQDLEALAHVARARLPSDRQSEVDTALRYALETL